MLRPILFSTAALAVPNLIIRSPLRHGVLLVLVAVALACFALPRAARAQLTPAPDGGYPGGNTAEGSDALFSTTTGTRNTAIGFQALYSNTTSDNTASGFQALRFNTTGTDNTAIGLQALFSNSTGSFNTANG